MADSGQLVCVLSGPKEAVDKVKPYTTGVMGRAIIDYSGQEPGHATLLKIIGNTFILNMVDTLSEGLTVAETTGLGVDNLHQVNTPSPTRHILHELMDHAVHRNHVSWSLHGLLDSDAARRLL